MTQRKLLNFRKVMSEELIRVIDRVQTHLKINATTMPIDEFEITVDGTFILDDAVKKSSVDAFT